MDLIKKLMKKGQVLELPDLLRETRTKEEIETKELL
jgi:hypothetical protein